MKTVYLKDFMSSVIAELESNGQYGTAMYAAAYCGL